MVDGLQGYLLLVIVVAVVAVGVFAVFIFLRRSKKSNLGKAGSLRRATLEKMEDDEEKVVKLLKAAGGQLYQSQISKHFGFSTSKTSELLGAMEKKGLIKRKTRGREKIVTLVKK